MKAYYRDKQAIEARKDLTGKRFGHLVVDEMIYTPNEPTRVKCTCDCGNKIERIATYLTSGETTSCGCVQKARASESNTKDFSGMVSDYGITLVSRNHKDDKGRWMWNCRCHCGNMFVALPAKILNGHTTSCGCTKRSSRERLIERVLTENGVKFKGEYIFPECRDKHPLRFDFYIESQNLAIEYQGEQHYMPLVKYGGAEQFERQKVHDAFKRNFCKEHNILLLELPYTLSDKEIHDKVTSIIYPERL